MKKILNTLIIFIIIISLNFCFSGCSKSVKSKDHSEITADNQSKIIKDYDICIYNSNDKISEQLANMCDYYTSETGVKIKIFSPPLNDCNIKELENELESADYPTIFTINNLDELNKVEKYGYVRDLNKSVTDNFKPLANDIPESLRLSSNNIKNAGIPYGIQSCGYIVDTKIIAGLFGDENVDDATSDIENCSFDEFKKLILSINNYINDSAATTVTINKRNYTLLPKKSEITKNLNGVFSVAGSESWTYGTQMLNIALSTGFSSQYEAYNASNSQMDLLESSFVKYLKALDLKTDNACGDSEMIKRGQSFIDPSVNGYDKAIENFANHKSMFLLQTSDAYSKIKAINEETALNIIFIPVKLPISQSDIAVKNITVEKFNNSIPFYVPTYYLINAKATEKEQKLSENFLIWLNTTDEGKIYLTEKFEVIPYNSSDDESYKNALNNSALNYKKSNNILKNICFGTPSGWSDIVVGNKIKNDYLTKYILTDEDYKKITDYVISEWKTMRTK